MSKTLKVLFTLSILLNLLMAGVIVGHGVKKWKDSDWYEIKDQLQPETRDQMRQAFRSGFKDVRPLFKDAHLKRKELSQILSAQDFDRDAYERAAADLQKLEGKMFAHKFKVVRDIVEGLPVSERKLLTEKFVSGFLDPRGGKKHHKNKKNWKKDGSVRGDHPKLQGGEQGKPLIIMPKTNDGSRSVPEDVEDEKPDFIVPENVQEEVLQDGENIIKDPADLDQ